MWNTVTENPPRQLLFSSFLFLLLSFTPLLAPLCFISWKLIFHPHFVFPVFSLSLALSLSALPPHFPRLAQFQFIKHFWRCRNLLFHYCTINHIGRAFSLHRHVDTLPPPNIISLVWQLLSWKMAVTASATQRSAREGGEENWTSSVWTHAVNYADPWTRHRMGAKSVDVFWALVKTGAERMREQLSSWSDFSFFFFGRETLDLWRTLKTNETPVSHPGWRMVNGAGHPDKKLCLWLSVCVCVCVLFYLSFFKAKCCNSEIK